VAPRRHLYPGRRQDQIKPALRHSATLHETSLSSEFGRRGFDFNPGRRLSLISAIFGSDAELRSFALQGQFPATAGNVVKVQLHQDDHRRNHEDEHGDEGVAEVSKRQMRTVLLNPEEYLKSSLNNRSAMSWR
jgi:hypothetical protein